MTRVEIKEKSKQQIKGHIWKLFLINVLFISLAMVHYIPLAGIAIICLFMPFVSFNFTRIYWNLATKNLHPEPAMLFANFETMWIKTWLLYVTVSFFTILWSLLLIIPGIVKGLSYSAAPYILMNNPNMNTIEALKTSQQVMEGHKMDLFILQLSFIGWSILVPFTLGLLSIWLIPYMYTAKANFYASIGVDNAFYVHAS